MLAMFTILEIVAVIGFYVVPVAIIVGVVWLLRKRSRRAGP
jgi:hypothetical protein